MINLIVLWRILISVYTILCLIICFCTLSFDAVMVQLTASLLENISHSLTESLALLSVKIYKMFSLKEFLNICLDVQCYRFLAMRDAIPYILSEVV